MIRFAFALPTCALALLAAACSPAPAAQPEPPQPEVATPADLAALKAAHDWTVVSGEKLNSDWNAGVKAILGKMSRPDAIAAIEAAGFSCIYGEAHEDYPDPMAVCSRSFATRACQMDWEISSTADKGMVAEVDGLFRRDCVGTDLDWPDAVKSAIDDGLVPAQPPQ
ncbi:MAG TPA: hypothetical protein PLN33_16730 [Hyphomonadaceae bacterium]|nr:hypothetical protein [Hyphomonadaceae bacterium]HPN05724.1 hypothetical protein [Hyphomonadaceae bacterium]